MRPTHKNVTAKTATPEPQRKSGAELQLGPYEASYDVTLGYGFERAIVTP